LPRGQHPQITINMENKMHLMLNRIGPVAAVAALALLTIPTAGSAEEGPTCSDTLGIAVHGEHVIGDYVTGSGTGSDEGFPPDGSYIGEILAENGGADIPGGPGPGFHFPEGIAPGASFCNDSRSPGQHL
jgi:hypothetical protein